MMQPAPTTPAHLPTTDASPAQRQRGTKKVQAARARMRAASSLTGRGGSAQHEQEDRMIRFRIYHLNGEGRWFGPSYFNGRDSKDVRDRLARAMGKDFAARACVTAVCDVDESLNPDLARAARALSV